MSLNKIMIFTKIPEPGLVKTRLTVNTVLSNIDASYIAEAMLKDTLLLSFKSESDLIELGYFPESKLMALEKIVDELRNDNFLTKPIAYYKQEGSNFNERFCSVVKKSFKENEGPLIVLGSDLPYLNPKQINYSFQKLSEKSNRKKIIIGPANEGGIYLVGINERFDPNWFIYYNLFSGGVEISQFINLCKQEKFELNLLPPLVDIDIEEDLVSLITFIEAMEVDENQQFFYYPKYTAKTIKELNLQIEEHKGETRKRKITKKKI